MSNYYSDNGVDRLLEGILPDIGHACDVGANDGIFNSNTLHFEEKGWTVLCIEANPRLAELGRSRRKLWRSVAAGPADEEVREFSMYGYSPWASSSALTPVPYTGAGTHEEVMVPVRTLDRLLEEAGFTKLDYLTIDVEGYEQEVLAGFSIERWKPTVIVFEEYMRTYPPIEGYEDRGKHLYDRVFVRKP